jgi:hypothetical protein
METTKLSIPTLSLLMDVLSKEHTKRLHEDPIIQALYKEGKDDVAKKAQKDFESNPHHKLGQTWRAIMEVQKQFDEYENALAPFYVNEQGN